MRLLLDTHIWLWSLLEPDKLSHRVARALGRADNELWLSPISVWELGMLVDRGRVKLRDELHGWVAEALSAVPLREAPITHDIALAAHTVSRRLPDPADRLLAATAKVLDLKLVTGDERLIDAREVPVLANR